jgi:hypothetical protein
MRVDQNMRKEELVKRAKSAPGFTETYEASSDTGDDDVTSIAIPGSTNGANF